MAVRRKTGAIGGGSWTGAIADGKIKIKSGGIGGGSWLAPSFCKVKANGVWVDSGYRGTPNNPSAPRVHLWNNSQVQVTWDAATGGTPIDYYRVEMRNEGGTYITHEDSTDLFSPVWGVSQDTKYQFVVQSHSANGLSGPMQGPLKVGIGHPETYNYGNVQRTRPWGTGGWIQASVNSLAGHAVPGNVICSAIHWNIWMSDGSAMISVEPARFIAGGDRYVEIILNDSYLWWVPDWPNPLNAWDYPVYWGNGGRTGIIPRERQTNAWLWKEVHGYIDLGGTEYYNNWEIVSTNPAQGNYYW